MPRSALALVCALACTLAACDFEQVIELDLPPYDPKITLGAYPTPDSVFTARVGRTTSASEPRAYDVADLLVADAAVVLFDGEGGFLDSLSYYEPFGTAGLATYRSGRGLRPQPGQTYRLRIDAPGLPSAEATTRLPDPVPVSARFVRYLELESYNVPAARLAVTLTDPPGEQVYSLSVSSQNQTPGGGSSPLINPFESDDPALRRSFEEIDLAVDFDIDLNRNEIYDRALFRDVLFEGQTREFTLDVVLFAFNEQGEVDDLVVTLATISDDYVRYQQTLALQLANEDNPFVEPVRIHTNVEGGLGVFAGYSTASARVPLD